MITLVHTMMSEVIGRGRKSARSDFCVQWPRNVLPYLEERFHLLPKEMAKLQCVGCRGSVGRLPVVLIRIWDRAEAYQRGITVKRYQDLDGYPELMRFEGHVFRDGLVHLRNGETIVSE